MIKKLPLDIKSDNLNPWTIGFGLGSQSFLGYASDESMNANPNWILDI